ncbi:MAG: PQQ-binding-like beta-propeller repeat protein [Patescibacteria group bacterium]
MRRVFALIIILWISLNHISIGLYLGNSGDQESVVFASEGTGVELKHQWNKTPGLVNFLMPAYQNGILYFAENNISTDDWLVYAFDKNTGQEQWRKTGVGDMESSVVVSGEFLVVPSSDLALLKSSSGEEVWRKSAGSNQVFTNPVVGGDAIYVVRQSTATKAMVLESRGLTDGSLSWSVDIPANTLPLSIWGESIITTSDKGSHILVQSYRLSDGVMNWEFRKNGRKPNSSVAITPDGFGLIADNKGYITKIDLATGSSTLSLPGLQNNTQSTMPIIADDKVYFFTQSVFSNPKQTFFNSYNYKTGQKIIEKSIASDFKIDTRVDVVKVDDRLYFVDKNKIYEVLTTDGSIKTYPVAENTGLLHLIHADGLFLAADYNYRNIYALSSGPTTVVADSRIELNSPYQSGDDYEEYIGQTHSHYIPDIGKKNIKPEFTVKKYRDAGYDFIALTEHNEIASNPNIPGITFIENSEEDTQGYFGTHILGVGISEGADETAESQTRIDQFYAQDGFVSLAHPDSFYYNWSFGELINLNGYHAIEAYNSGIDAAGKYLEVPEVLGRDAHGRASAFKKWDKLLVARKKVWATAGDDFTPRNPGFDGASVAVFARENTQDEIMSNMKLGNFYALQGTDAPRIKISTDSGVISAAMGEMGTIRFIGRGGEILKEVNDSLGSSYQPEGSEIYVRIEAENKGGKKSWSQPIFVNMVENTDIVLAGEKKVDLASASISAKTTGEFRAETKDINGLLVPAPAGGYLSPVYNFEGALDSDSSANLEIDYSASDLVTNEDALSVFTFDAISNSWNKVASDIDKANKKVLASLSHFSLYTLSTEINADTEKPVVELAAPTELVGLSGSVLLQINSVDNNKTLTVSGYLDDQTILFDDTTASDGFDNTVNFSLYPSGSHVLTLLAEDAFGNIAEKKYSIDVSNFFQPPALSLASPLSGGIFCDDIQIEGKYSGSLGAEPIGVFVNDEYIDGADVASGKFSKHLSLSDVDAGDGTLKLIVIDLAGNKSETVVRFSKSCPSGIVEKVDQPASIAPSQDQEQAQAQGQTQVQSDSSVSNKGQSSEMIVESLVSSAEAAVANLITEAVSVDPATARAEDKGYKRSGDAEPERAENVVDPLVSSGPPSKNPPIYTVILFGVIFGSVGWFFGGLVIIKSKPSILALIKRLSKED